MTDTVKERIIDVIFLGLNEVDCFLFQILLSVIETPKALAAYPSISEVQEVFSS
jgi:hypothetical protein